MKYFDEDFYIKLEDSCGSCQHYYTNNCDAMDANCNSYKPIRLIHVEKVLHQLISVVVVDTLFLIFLAVILFFKLLL